MRPLIARAAAVTVFAATAVNAQSSSTNCLNLGAGMIHCDTTPTDSNSGADLGTALGQALTGTGDQHVRMNIGKMLASGNCDGALKYALQKGRFDLAQTVRDYCASASPVQMTETLPAVPSAVGSASNSGPRKVRARTPSGYCLDVPPGYVGTGAANMPAVTSAMPACDQLSAP